MTTIDERAVWTLWAWGANSCGQLGCGHCEDLLVPTPFALADILNPQPRCPRSVQCKFVPGSAAGSPHGRPIGLVRAPVLQSTGGGAFSVLLTETGQVLTCGKDERGQLGHGRKKSEGGDESPGTKEVTVNFSKCEISESLSTKINQVEAGWDFVVALTDTGIILTWGSNSFGQLGRILPQGLKMDAMPKIVDYYGNRNNKVVTVAAGLRHAVAITDNGLVYCWGSGRKGQLGVTGPEGKPLASSNVPIQASLIDGEKPIKAMGGMNFSGILTEKGTIFVWGCNKYGQCGVSPATEMTLPTPRCLKLSDDIPTVVSIVAGWTHAVLRTENGNLYSWGRTDLGQLGRKTDAIPQHIPGLITGVTNIATHCCSSEHNLALTDKGQVYSWGWNEHGICGTGDETNMFFPKLIPCLETETAVSVGCGAGHCFCWTMKQGN